MTCSLPPMDTVSWGSPAALGGTVASGVRGTKNDPTSSAAAAATPTSRIRVAGLILTGPTLGGLYRPAASSPEQGCGVLRLVGEGVELGLDRWLSPREPRITTSSWLGVLPKSCGHEGCTLVVRDGQATPQLPPNFHFWGK